MYSELKNSTVAVVAIVLILICSKAIQAQLINFEAIPGGTSFEGLVISNQFEATVGVSFSLEGGGHPVLAQVGNPTTAFANDALVGDMPAPGQGIGSFFLTDDGVLSGLSAPPLIVTYSTPTDSASGVVLDIDFDEQFVIEARDAGDNVLETVTIMAGDPGTGDALATRWEFQRATAEVASIRFVGSRQVDGAFGLGFDNFNARSPLLVGDVDGDAFVGINDLNAVLGGWNQTVPPANPLADLSGDGFIGIDDLNAVLANWNAGTPPVGISSVPEPAAIIVMLLTAPAWITRNSGRA